MNVPNLNLVGAIYRGGIKSYDITPICKVCECIYTRCSDPKDKDADKINALNMCKDCFLNWAADHYCQKCSKNLVFEDGRNVEVKWCEACWSSFTCPGMADPGESLP